MSYCILFFNNLQNSTVYCCISRMFELLYQFILFCEGLDSHVTSGLVGSRKIIRCKGFNLCLITCRPGFILQGPRWVRSATLDTWLPEQVAFIQYICIGTCLGRLICFNWHWSFTAMGNEKANSYWEAELLQTMTELE
ncbi:uncharacterized protein LOC109847725 isoform X2 [Asparagus officinalis]|uniref:uncharacterized protein LOC109847725 isoform X2 n=1 Tax=Asparagus officinalis TaxID=4686 RepID=UPI00098E23EC|nr:uncharacterized protein LOC109847725 isoform X2 [Asparagus officinalis]